MTASASTLPIEGLQRVARSNLILTGAYGARLAMTEQRARHVLVTDPDGWVWKEESNPRPHPELPCQLQ